MNLAKRSFAPAWLMALSCAATTAASLAPPKQSTKGPDVIHFGEQTLVSKGACFFWGGTMSAGYFFHGLKRRDSIDGPRFYKKDSEVLYYPEKLSIILRVMKSPCDARGHVTSLHALELPDDFVSSLKFRAEWKTGVLLRPVDNFTVLSREHKPMAFNLASEQFSNDVVEYEMIVTSKAVPLSDHLIIFVLADDDKDFVRLSASP